MLRERHLFLIPIDLALGFVLRAAAAPRARAIRAGERGSSVRALRSAGWGRRRLTGAVDAGRGSRGGGFGVAPRLVARTLGGDIGLGLSDHELFFGQARAARELGELVGAEDEDRDAGYDAAISTGENMRVSGLEQRVG